MIKSSTARAKRGRHYRRHADTYVTRTRQPRPSPRRQGTRQGAISAALREV